MKTKKVFLCSAGISVVVLIIILILLNTLPPVMSYSDGIGLYGVLVSIVVGIFTVWGLFWAASEFSDAQIKPDLKLMVGARYRDGTIPLIKETDPLIGHNIEKSDPPLSQVNIGLFLENYQPKAAQFIRITLRLKDAQSILEFKAVEGGFKYYKPKINIVEKKDHAIFLQFGEDLVVYKGDGVFLGMVYARWEKDSRPNVLTIEAGLYNLIGNPKIVTISHPIDWD